jgi:hypothetical protein
LRALLSTKERHYQSKIARQNALAAFGCTENDINALLVALDSTICPISDSRRVPLDSREVLLPTWGQWQAAANNPWAVNTAAAFKQEIGASRVKTLNGEAIFSLEVNIHAETGASFPTLANTTASTYSAIGEVMQPLDTEKAVQQSNSLNTESPGLAISALQLMHYIERPPSVMTRRHSGFGPSGAAQSSGLSDFEQERIELKVVRFFSWIFKETKVYKLPTAVHGRRLVQLASTVGPRSETGMDPRLVNTTSVLQFGTAQEIRNEAAKLLEVQHLFGAACPRLGGVCSIRDVGAVQYHFGLGSSHIMQPQTVALTQDKVNHPSANRPMLVSLHELVTATSIEARHKRAEPKGGAAAAAAAAAADGDAAKAGPKSPTNKPTAGASASVAPAAAAAGKTKGAKKGKDEEDAKKLTLDEPDILALETHAVQKEKLTGIRPPDAPDLTAAEAANARREKGGTEALKLLVRTLLVETLHVADRATRSRVCVDLFAHYDFEEQLMRELVNPLTCMFRKQLMKRGQLKKGEFESDGSVLDQLLSAAKVASSLAVPEKIGDDDEMPVVSPPKKGMARQKTKRGFKFEKLRRSSIVGVLGGGKVDDDGE